MTNKRWQDWLLLLGGVWLFIAPWGLGTDGESGSSWNAWVLGALVIATAAWALVRQADTTPEWLQGFFGLWLFVAPWLIGFTDSAAASWNAWIVGVGIIAVAWWAITDQNAVAEMRPRATEDHSQHVSH